MVARRGERRIEKRGDTGEEGGREDVKEDRDILFPFSAKLAYLILLGSDRISGSDARYSPVDSTGLVDSRPEHVIA